MSPNRFEKQRAAQLRKAAETQLATTAQTEAPDRSVSDLLHELHVYQVELEMQNEELRRAQSALEESRDHYMDFYEFAPVGYLTVSREGLISEINLTAVALLGVDRKKLLRHRFAHFVVSEDCDGWHQQFVRMFRNKNGMQRVELRLKRGDDTVFHAQLDCVNRGIAYGAAIVPDVGSPLEPNAYGIRIALSDVTARKNAEEELIHSEAQLRQLSGHLLQVHEEERSHFARELHDELGQNLSALRIAFDLFADELGTRRPAMFSRLAAINQMILGTGDAMHRICEDLRPGVLDDLGLEAALGSHVKRWAKQSGIACDLELDCEVNDIGEPISTAIFRIVQESLTNIARHARATRVEVSLHLRGENLQLTIADDGCGLPSELNGEKRSYGLLGMRERVNMLGGHMTIDSKLGRGTHIEVNIPRQREVAL